MPWTRGTVSWTSRPLKIRLNPQDLREVSMEKKAIRVIADLGTQED
jgi:hypothetical protein